MKQHNTTTVAACDDTLEIAEPDLEDCETDMKGNFSSITNPQVCSVIANQYYKCNSSICSKKLTVTPGSKTVRSQYCRRVMLVSACKRSLHADIEFIVNKTTYRLAIFDNVLSKVFPDTPLDDIEERILLLDDFEVTFNSIKAVEITS